MQPTPKSTLPTALQAMSEHVEPSEAVRSWPPTVFTLSDGSAGHKNGPAEEGKASEAGTTFEEAGSGSEENYKMGEKNGSPEGAILQAKESEFSSSAGSAIPPESHDTKETVKPELSSGRLNILDHSDHSDHSGCSSSSLFSVSPPASLPATIRPLLSTPDDLLPPPKKATSLDEVNEALQSIYYSIHVLHGLMQATSGNVCRLQRSLDELFFGVRDDVQRILESAAERASEMEAGMHRQGVMEGSVAGGIAGSIKRGNYRHFGGQRGLAHRHERRLRDGRRHSRRSHDMPSFDFGTASDEPKRSHCNYCGTIHECDEDDESRPRSFSRLY